MLICTMIRRAEAAEHAGNGNNNEGEANPWRKRKVAENADGRNLYELYHDEHDTKSKVMLDTRSGA